MIRKKMSSKTDILFESIERRGFGHFFTHIGICLFTNWCSMQFLPYNVKGGGTNGLYKQIYFIRQERNT